MAARLIKVKVVTKAGFNIVKEEAGALKVYTSAAPEKGKANKVVIKLIAQFLGKRPLDVSIVKGEQSKNKIIQVID